MSRVFLDANIVIDGVVSRWSVSKAVLILCARHVHQLVLCVHVREEIEDALLRLAASARFSRREARQMLDDYLTFLKFAEPEMVDVAAHEPEMQQASIIRHLHDVPVLAAALKAKPAWVLSTNRKHFSPLLANRTGLRIADPLEFFQALHRQ